MLAKYVPEARVSTLAGRTVAEPNDVAVIQQVRGGELSRRAVAQRMVIAGSSARPTRRAADAHRGGGGGQGVLTGQILVTTGLT